MGEEKKGMAHFFKNGYFYKLVSIGEDWPTIEISGIRMHQLPVRRKTFEKINLLEPLQGMRALEICTGLGYSAMEMAKRGARVITIEKDENVIDMARLNPFSQELFSEKLGIIIEIGDGCEVVREYVRAQEGFDRILHDPPRFARAGELYSQDFYSLLHGLLNPGGILFHYAGNPNSLYREGSFLKKIKQRLSLAGFRKIYWKNAVLGFLCRKT